MAMTWTGLRREPFRILFPLAILSGAIGVGHWLAFALGWTESYSGSFHAHIQVWGYIGSFAIGFLLTALPRSAGAPPASSLELAAALALVTGTIGAVALERWALANAIEVVLLGLIIAFAGRRFASRRTGAPPPPIEFVWIPIGLLFGVAGSLVAAAGRLDLLPSPAVKIGEVAAQQGFLLGIVLGVGGFMAPRLMGHGDVIERPLASAGNPSRIRSKRLGIYFAAALALAASFAIEGLGAVRWAYLLRGGVVLVVLLLAARITRRPRVGSLFVRMLWISLWMTPAGLLAAGVLPSARVAMLHLTFIGGFALMTFAMGTMVVMSHSGEARRLMQPLWILRLAGAGVAAALAGRLAADAHSERYFEWLGAAAVAWLFAAIAWIAFARPRLARIGQEDDFERSHEAVKADLLRRAAKDPRVSAAGSGRVRMSPLECRDAAGARDAHDAN
jgi:uncharacterized protein involved in response to NO